MPSSSRITLAAATIALLTACVGPPAGGFRQGPGGVDPLATRYINPGTLAALPGFTHAVRVGPTVYVSGEVALDSTGQLVGPGDLRAQAAQAFANLATVLRIAGAVPADVAKLTIYVVNTRSGDLDLIRAAAPDFFPERNPPAGTVVGVQALPRDGLLIAVDATAVVRAMFRPLDERLRHAGVLLELRYGLLAGFQRLEQPQPQRVPQTADHRSGAAQGVGVDARVRDHVKMICPPAAFS